MMKKKYHIYGMGNALVDMEVLVSDDFLIKHKIEKGLMTLVEEKKQEMLTGAIQNEENSMQCGGSAANTIIAASQLGAHCFYSCKVANDELGTFYINDLQKNGVNSNLNRSELENGITGKCLVMVTDDAERTMNTFLGITSQYSDKELDVDALKDAEFLYMEGYLVTGPEARKAMVQAKKVAESHNVKVALTFSDPSMVKYFKEGLVEVIGAGVDLLFCNEEEAKIFTEKDSLEDAIIELKKITRQFAITRGVKGALLYDGENIISIDPHLVEAVDTNGAGDMFAGAFLYGITHGNNFEKAGELASLASSRVVCQFGPRLNELEISKLKKA